MQAARIVVGEDGSALHNVAFAESGLTLGVLTTPERDNLYHLTLCQIKDHRLAFCPLAETDAPEQIKVRLDDFLNTLEAGADL
jgi:capsular polysaccharide biosynthesis protein